MQPGFATISTPPGLPFTAPDSRERSEAPAGRAEAAHGASFVQFVPPVPETLQEAGLASTLVEELIVKTIYFHGEITGADIARSLGLQFFAIERVILGLRRQRFLEVKESMGLGEFSSTYVLSDSGRIRARECLEQSQYAGTAPVPLAQYTDAVHRQRLPNGWLTPNALAKAYRHMVTTPELLGQVGPAVNSGKAFLIYGKPGNGKTYLAEAFGNLEQPPIYIPRSIECNGQIIQLYDPVYHRPAGGDSGEPSVFMEQAAFDARWVRIRRPLIVTGGELKLEMLDLAYNPNSRVYDAPFQMKANNGIYLIDDFGRQKASPAEILNRWVVPMERSVDYLSFQTGGKVEAPFETFLVFSTNLKPDDLGDEAFLRRIEYKLLVKNPSVDEFTQIFERFCASQRVGCSRRLIDSFVEKHYASTGKPFRRCHPRDVIRHAIDLINFESLPFELSESILDRAFASCFLDTTDAEG